MMILSGFIVYRDRKLAKPSAPRFMNWNFASVLQRTRRHESFSAKGLPHHIFIIKCQVLFAANVSDMHRRECVGSGTVGIYERD